MILNLLLDSVTFQRHSFKTTSLEFVWEIVYQDPRYYMYLDYQVIFNNPKYAYSVFFV